MATAYESMKRNICKDCDKSLDGQQVQKIRSYFHAHGFPQTFKVCMDCNAKREADWANAFQVGGEC